MFSALRFLAWSAFELGHADLDTGAVEVLSIVSYCLQNYHSCTLHSECILFSISVECDRGSYGANCASSCGTGCTDGDCDSQTGHCECQGWWTSDKCDTEVSGETKHSTRVCTTLTIVHSLVTQVINQFLPFHTYTHLSNVFMLHGTRCLEAATICGQHIWHHWLQCCRDMEDHCWSAKWYPAVLQVYYRVQTGGRVWMDCIQ